MTFPCTKCGACCRRAWTFPDFPLPLNEDGSCSRLQGNLCSIYETRPDVCRTEMAYLRARELLSLTESQFMRQLALRCNLAQQADGMDESFRVVLD